MHRELTQTYSFEQLYKENYARLYYYAFRFITDEEVCKIRLHAVAVFRLVRLEVGLQRLRQGGLLRLELLYRDDGADEVRPRFNDLSLCHVRKPLPPSFAVSSVRFFPTAR